MKSLWSSVASQGDRIPSMYGAVDFSVVPERFTDRPGDKTELPEHMADRRAALLADHDRVELIRAYSLMGDPVADAYAALMARHGFRPLVDLLVNACDHGVERVADAPPELAAFISDMERKPEWVDMKLVEEGARFARNYVAHLGPLIIRGAFIATFMNKYSALPMAITNTLSSQTAARRVKETTSFFTASVLPHALDRFGPGFKAAAMVRLMHSMVRVSLLRRPNDWDTRVYGIPIPQVDQMPAGLLTTFLLAERVLAQGRNQFSRRERGRVELARYRCFLLGLPEALLPDTPQGIVDMMLTRCATLRLEYDDNICGELVRATMAADLRPGDGVGHNIHAFFEKRVAKLYFLKNFMAGDRKAAAAIGVQVGPLDAVVAAAVGLVTALRIGLHLAVAHLPVLGGMADRRLVAKLERQLAEYGKAHFTTNAAHYRSEAKPSSVD